MCCSSRTMSEKILFFSFYFWKTNLFQFILYCKSGHWRMSSNYNINLLARNFNAFAAFEDNVFMFAYKRMFTKHKRYDTLRSIQNSILIKHTYTLWDLRSFLLDVSNLFTQWIHPHISVVKVALNRKGILVIVFFFVYSANQEPEILQDVIVTDSNGVGMWGECPVKIVDFDWKSNGNMTLLLPKRRFLVLLDTASGIRIS